MNTLKQTFTPTSSTLTFAVWLFSWETRDADSLTLQFTKGPASAPVAAGTFTTFTVGENPGVTCTGSTLNGCLNSPITAGSSGFIGSHAWTYVTVNDLLPWVPVTFTASIGSGNNNSFASWLYLDNVNTPPVAKFSRLYPQTKIGGVASGPIEGSAVKLNDTSYDPDPGDKIVAWTWTVTGPGLPGVLVSHAQSPSFMPPDNGDYSISLTVTDTQGATGTTSVSDPPAPAGPNVAVDTAPFNVLRVNNAPPLVNAPNIQVLANRAFTVSGRFTDAGWLIVTRHNSRAYRCRSRTRSSLKTTRPRWTRASSRPACPGCPPERIARA